MATSASKDSTAAQDVPAQDPHAAPKADAKNPSGASEEQLKKGEMVGKVRGPDVDSSYHVYEFTDPNTGEPVEWTPVVHDVPVGVNSDGSVKMGKGNDDFVKPSKDEATK